jgi:hypothetical protein
MGTIVIETFIARSPEEVFTYLRDISNQARWQSEHVSEVIVEPPGPAKVGTRYHKVRRTPTGEQRFTEEIVEMDETAWHWMDVTRTGPFRGTKGSWQVLAETGGACVRLTAEMHAQGFWRLLLPVIDRSARKDLEAEFAYLKKVLESD